MSNRSGASRSSYNHSHERLAPVAKPRMVVNKFYDKQLSVKLDKYKN
jgi:hypothetical protein